ncbi:hypothetical protein F7731_11305 [Cytobacillus depressus]|uniref:DUF5658 domain-containing protein n=1 Tax=Cytobacillus depressus TaxID=1602942 RepID=A0A6L3V4N2_9BACI|nr:DUF5658 family protein [Cytobacillus depressus]KAB2336091.1 hypothetical protein F7731_11305 [Cytobacillus depressus]
MKGIFLYLAVINFVDGMVTFLGIRFSIIEEGNPFMNALYQASPLGFLVLKTLLSCILLTFIFFKKLPSRPSIKNLALAGSLLYTMVCLLHGVWIAKFLLMS